LTPVPTDPTPTTDPVPTTRPTPTTHPTPTIHPVRILFVCLGNICRSPTAEGVMRALVREAGLDDAVELDSAGTGGWHVGSSPDDRATQTALTRGIVLEGAARQVRAEDFEDFDLILAMDDSNLAELRRLAPGEQARSRLRMLREFDPASAAAVASRPSEDLDVPDPYYGGPGGFEDVLDIVQAACLGLLEELRARLVQASGRGETGPHKHARPRDAKFA
jgi:protein-tyrosine phosphatase